METPAGSADGERPDMTQRTVGRFLAGAALAVTLTFAGAAPAGAVPWPAADGLWSRLAEILTGWGGAPRLWYISRTVGSAPGRSSSSTRRRYCIDPNGHTVTCAGSQTSGAGLPRCAAWNDAGGCIDPHG